MFRKHVEKLRHLLVGLLRQGTTPRKLAITCALGVVIGIFPLYGSTTLLCFALAVPLRLNVLLIQAVNYLLTPVQLLLILPFMQSGTWLFGLPPLPFSWGYLAAMGPADFRKLMWIAGQAVVAAMVVWALITALLLPLLFWSFFRLFSSGRFGGKRL